MDRELTAAVDEVRRRWAIAPVAAIVLGTGLGRLARHVDVDVSIPYGEIPGFFPATAPSHCGRLVCGHLRGVPLLLLDGRCHIYEGHSLAAITFPIRVVHACGASTLIATNAAGGLRAHFSTGDVMVIEDHINLMGKRLSGWCGFEPRWRPQRVEPTPYDAALRKQAVSVARREGCVVHEGVYAAVPGPNYETRAEYELLRSLGADAVGMSTVPEVQVARRLDMRVLGLSIVTNVARAEVPQVVDAWHVVSAAEHAEPHVRAIITEVVGSLRPLAARKSRHPRLQVGGE